MLLLIVTVRSIIVTVLLLLEFLVSCKLFGVIGYDLFTYVCLYYVIFICTRRINFTRLTGPVSTTMWCLMNFVLSK